MERKGCHAKGLACDKNLERVCHCVWEGEGKKKRVVRW
jgi:hypothetical protein